jgi:hypothetical protein
MPRPQKTPPKPPRYRSTTRYKRTETARLLKGAMDAGLAVRGLEVDSETGDLRVLVIKPDASGDNKSDDRNEWDDVQ